MKKQEDDSPKLFKVEISEEVFHQMQSIKHYIADVKLNPRAAEKLINIIF